MLEFWIPMLLIFLAAIIAAVAARRKKDRCLKFFHQRPATILMDDGKRMWGVLLVYAKALELEFENPVEDDNGLTKASYVLYEPEIAGVQRILQTPPEKGTEAFVEWEQELEQVANPTFERRFKRSCWNAFNTLRDAVSQAMSMVLGTLKSKTPMGKVATADKRAGEIGNTLLGTIPNAYEPVLEKYLSYKVVVEVLEADNVREYVGLLQEYSDKYLLLRNVSYKAHLASKTEPEQFDIIFPRSKALVRHRLNKE